jgi:hypothetical protein
VCFFLFCLNFKYNLCGIDNANKFCSETLVFFVVHIILWKIQKDRFTNRRLLAYDDSFASAGFLGIRI